MPRALPQLRPLTARSVVLSLLIGTVPPQLSTRELTAFGEHFGIAAGTMRVALSRMLAAGDLVRAGADYRLAERHRDRHARTEARLHPRRLPYDGTWSMVVVTGRGRDAGDRASLRSALAGRRYGELREGVWLRPANLLGEPVPAGPDLATFTTVPADDHALARGLWDLDGWAATARALLDLIGAELPPVERLTAAAAAVRHLVRDPALPDELAPAHWPGPELRHVYESYRSELALLKPLAERTGVLRAHP